MQCTSHFAQLVDILKARSKCPRFLLRASSSATFCSLRRDDHGVERAKADAGAGREPAERASISAGLVHEPGAPVALQPFP